MIGGLNKKYLIVIFLVVVVSYFPEIKNYPARFFRSSNCRVSNLRLFGCNLDDLDLEITDCEAISLGRYVVTDVCNCETPSAFEYEFEEEGEFKIEFCSKFAGGDGVIAKVSNGSKTKEKLVPPMSCRTLEIFSRGYLRFSVERYGRCRGESITWKALFLE